MSSLVALAVSIGVLGAIAAILCLNFGLLIWAAFIGWACFFHSGGTPAALKLTISCNVFGAICAWVAAMVILSFPLATTLTLPVWAGIVVGITVIVVISLVLGALFGYASGKVAATLTTKATESA